MENKTQTSVAGAIGLHLIWILAFQIIFFSIYYIIWATPRLIHNYRVKQLCKNSGVTKYEQLARPISYKHFAHLQNLN